MRSAHQKGFMSCSSKLIRGTRTVLFTALLMATAFGQEEINPFRPVAEVRLSDGRILRDFRALSYTREGINGSWSGGRGVVPYDLFPTEWGNAIARFRPRPSQMPAEERRPSVVSSEPAPEPKQPVIPNPRLDITPLTRVARNDSVSDGKERVVSGQCFVVTKGRQNYKMGLVRVLLYPEAAFDAYSKEITRRRLQYLTAVANAREVAGKRRLPTDLYPEGVDAYLHESWSALPPGDATSQTDADGNFTIKHFVTGRFVLFARAERSVGSKTEYYVWAVSSADIEDSGRVFLSNDNMMSR